MSNYTVETISLHISYACTHHCPMCYASASATFSPPTFEKVKAVINNICDNGINNIAFVGGDPAIYPFIIEISELAHSRGSVLSILSNTLDFNGRLAEAAKYIDAFEVTVHAETAERHNDFCGKEKAYELLMENLKYFSDMNKKIGLTINIMPYTYNHIYSIVNNVIKQNIHVSYVVFQRIIPFGKAENVQDYELTHSDIDKALQFVKRIEKDLGLKIIFEDTFPLCAIDAQYHNYMHPCDWGLTKVSVDYNGNISRCGADIKNFLGNIFDKPITELWNTSNELKFFRDKGYLLSKCKNCVLLEKCGGGCPISRQSMEKYAMDYMTNEEKQICS